MKVKITQLCLILCDPVDHTFYGILQARILEWVACPFSSRSSWPRDWTQVSHIASGFFTSWAIMEAQRCASISKSPLILSWYMTGDASHACCRIERVYFVPYNYCLFSGPLKWCSARFLQKWCLPSFFTGSLFSKLLLEELTIYILRNTMETQVWISRNEWKSQNYFLYYWVLKCIVNIVML